VPCSMPACPAPARTPRSGGPPAPAQAAHQLAVERQAQVAAGSTARRRAGCSAATARRARGTPRGATRPLWLHLGRCVSARGAAQMGGYVSSKPLLRPRFRVRHLEVHSFSGNVAIADVLLAFPARGPHAWPCPSRCQPGQPVRNPRRTAAPAAQAFILYLIGCAQSC